ncbi:hypothetical protein PSY31_23050, partial [Shigella flexneri]|nr:hypothetical protein [Shigella flexneri]
CLYMDLLEASLCLIENIGKPQADPCIDKGTQLFRVFKDVRLKTTKKNDQVNHCKQAICLLVLELGFIYRMA